MEQARSADLSIPYGRGPAKRDAFGRRVVLETGNPTLSRDGALAGEVMGSGRGTGAYLREPLPGVRVVCAFNTVWDKVLASEAHRAGPRVSLPLASDNKEALQIASALVVDAGFDPVIVGPGFMTPVDRAPRSVRLWASP